MTRQGRDSRRLRIAVLASGAGTTFAALADGVQPLSVGAEVVLLIVSRPDVGAVSPAGARGIECVVLDEKAIGTGRCDEEMVALLRDRDVDLVVLAGYLRKIGPRTLEGFSGRIINTHPAPLPRFGGKGMYGEHVHRAVLESGATESAATVHLVDPEYDTGRVIAERSVPIHDDDDVPRLRERVRRAERELLIETALSFRHDMPQVSGVPPQE